MRQVTSTSNGRVAVKGTHASGGFSVGRKIVNLVPVLLNFNPSTLREADGAAQPQLSDTI